MSIARIDIRLEDLQAPGARPLTRDTVISLADRLCADNHSEAHIIVTELKHFPDEEPSRGAVARIELRREPGQAWCLQHVSHPNESRGATAALRPMMDDYTAYVAARHALNLPPARRVQCAEELEAEECRPCDCLSLNPSFAAPLVPTWKDLRAFELAQALSDVVTFGPTGRLCRHCGQPA